MNISISMWGRALRVIPRVSKKEWNALDPIAKWLIASRSAVFIMTVFSVIIGGLLAADLTSVFDWTAFGLCLIGLVLAHATNNLLNDYTDAVRGVDSDNYFRTIYGPQAVQSGLWTRRRMLQVIALTGILAVSCGLLLMARSGDVLLIPMLTGAFFVLFYTWPLKLIGLGEPSVLVVWGPLMVGGTYAAITGEWSWTVALIGAVYALGPTTVLFGKHTDKLKEDKKKGIHTLPVILGERYARYSVIVMMLVQPVITAALVVAGILDWPMLLILLAYPRIWSSVKPFTKPRPDSRPKEFPEAAWPTYLAAYAFYSNRVSGGLFALGLLISLFVG